MPDIFNKILVVDDNTANLQLLMSLLNEQGYVVYPASDGELALEFTQSTLPDLILLDIKMPGMDGYEVCRRFKADERTASIPVIFLSALEDERDKVKGFQTGGVDYLTKPFQQEELLARVRIHLRIRELTEGLEHEVDARTEELMVANKRLEEEIAERKRAEEELRKLNNDFVTLLENTGDFIYFKDIDNRFLFCSQTLANITGHRSWKDMLGKDDFDVFPEETARIYREEEGPIFSEGKVLLNKVDPYFDAQGERRWVNTNKWPVFDDNGVVVGIFGISRDITEQKHAEDELRLLSERLQLATRAASIGIWDWDIVKNELLWDDSMYQLYGIQAEEFSGAYEAWARTIHPDDKAYTEGEIQAALRGEREYAPEFRIVRPDGSIRYIKAESKTFRGQDGEPLRMIGTNIDITELKQSEEKLRHYKDNLEETVQERTEALRLARDAAEAANKAKSIFLANMSHELRTPLNAILGFSQLMRQDQSLSSRQHETIDIINNSGDHLLKLINDVLEIAKIEAGKLQLEIATFDLHDLVREVSDMMGLRAQQKGLQLELDQSSEFPRYIKGDEARLRQILVNLVSNAVKFTEQGGVTIRLGTEDNAHHHLLIEVKDTGPGIGKKERQHLFKPFEQLSDAKFHEGTGLGLAIVRQFVQLMGGEVAVASTPGKGSLFHVKLPLNEADEAEVIRLSNERHGAVAGLAPGQPSRRILIAEDQRENQLLISRLMTELGLEVKVAEDGEKCVRLFQEWQPDLIWMDWRMPVLNGEEATRQIRQLPGGDKVKIIAITASALKEQEAALRASGIDDYVSKPYRFDEIYSRLERQLGLHFIYTETNTDRLVPALDVKKLAVLPKALRTELRDALERLEPNAIGAVIRQVAEQDAELANGLSRITERLDYQIILDVLKEGS